MRIVVNHLTRMREERICIAGIDESTGLHIRPTTARTDPITRSLLSDAGGPLDVGAVVDLGPVEHVPSPPEIEDHRFSTRNARLIRRLAPDEYLQLLEQASETDLETAFGPDLERRGWKYAVEGGAGHASLAVVEVQRPPRLEIDDRYGRLQLRFNDSKPPAFLPVTDLRLVEADHRTIKRDVVDDVQRRLERGVDAFVMLGLARPFQASGDDRERHWLQVNGICLVDQPIGRLP